ncbi:WD repeat-containing protein 6 [Amblyraja radiata]|uniref:WD repeat-containing protein 6 n=1 Tax=Amblyraja radiata TaxID=386614 RepID=UPI0014036044|nr:WD repeat-containing protein 6 [Amblyraja radiata]XP_032892893.1 WD repeat-containing protein 6 [Amblyraja radiata]
MQETAATMQCESLSLQSPITALQFVGDFILSGEGAGVSLHFLNSTSGRVEKRIGDVLKNYRVHGIETRGGSGGSEPTVLAVYGGKGVAVIELDAGGEEPELRRVGPLYELHDWIWDLRWLRADEQPAGHLALALGHNSVVLCDYWSQRSLREVHCEEKCILYSAHFVGGCWDELVLVSGTVFNQLVLWQMEGPLDLQGRVRAGRRISGHSGVIFSIDYRQESGVLASASDDRSVGLWRVGDLGRGAEGETQCLLRMYGHQSRVWRVWLLEDFVVSAGEDSACLLWTYSGEVARSFRGHRGSLRALAVSEDQQRVATGGEDSAIRLWKIGDEEPEDVTVIRLQLGDAEGVGSPKALASVDPTLVLVMTDSGGVYSCCLVSGRWKLLLEDQAYRSYGLLSAAALPSGSVLCALGNIQGCLKIFPVFRPELAVERREHRGKVHSLSWASLDGQGPDQCNLFSSGPEGEMLWWEVSWAQDRLSWVGRGRFLLPACKHRWHTCAAFAPGLPYLACGDRRGSLLLYSTDEGPEPVSELPGLHGKSGVTSVLFHGGLLHSSGRDGFCRQLRVEAGRLGLLRCQRACGWVERLLPLEPSDHDGPLLGIGFRAADFVAWGLESEQRPVLRVPCGGGHRSWCFSGSVSPAGLGLFAYIKSGGVYACQWRGRREAGAMVKEGAHGRDITSVRLLGRLEAYTSVLATASEDTSVNVLALHTASGRLTKLADISDHLSSVRAMAVVRGPGPSALLFTAGGRAQLRCSRLLFGPEDTNSGLRCRVEQLGSHRLSEDWERRKNRHRMLKMDPETRYMSIVVVDGGMDSEGNPHSSWHYLAAACSDGAVRLFIIDESEKKILLLAESFYHQRCVLKLQTFTHQPASGSQVVFLCSAATDGRIALWNISGIIETAKGADIRQERTRQPLELGTPCLVFVAHQCGVNGLDVRSLDDGRFLLASGGDDNAVRIWVICITPWAGSDGPLSPSSSERQEEAGSGSREDRGDEAAEDSRGWSNLGVVADCWSLDGGLALRVLKGPSAESAHAAHVTGLRFLSSRMLVSASIDQRLNHWALSSRCLTLIHSRWCQVADIAELESWEGHPAGTHLFALCGDGLQVLKSWQTGTDGPAPETDSTDARGPR